MLSQCGALSCSTAQVSAGVTASTEYKYVNGTRFQQVGVKGGIVDVCPVTQYGSAEQRSCEHEHHLC
jgi:ferredoxin-like protein FixX